MTVHHHGGGDLHIACIIMNVTPVIDQSVFDHHAVGQEEGESGTLVAEHKQIHLFANFAVISSFGFLHHGLPLG